MSQTRRSIILIGPVGAGKNTIGALLATHLSLPFTSIDEQVATHLGETVASAMITQPDACETLQQELATTYLAQAGNEPLVLVLPPAATTTPHVSAAITEAKRMGSLVIELTVDVTELARRLGLNGPRTTQLGAPRAMLARMLADTHTHHASLADVSVTTVGHSIEQVLQEVLAAL